MISDSVANDGLDSRVDNREDARIAWCREHIAGFADLHDHSLKARRDTEESRRRLGRQIAPPTMLASYAANKAGRAA